MCSWSAIETHLVPMVLPEEVGYSVVSDATDDFHAIHASVLVVLHSVSLRGLPLCGRAVVPLYKNSTFHRSSRVDISPTDLTLPRFKVTELVYGPLKILNVLSVLAVTPELTH